jgi:hypothetical protein
MHVTMIKSMNTTSIPVLSALLYRISIILIAHISDITSTSIISYSEEMA